MCIYRGTELFMTTWWPGTFEKKIFRENKSNCFCLTKRNSNLLRNLYTWDPSLQRDDIKESVKITSHSTKKVAALLTALSAMNSTMRLHNVNI